FAMVNTTTLSFTLFPYTTLFRSDDQSLERRHRRRGPASRSRLGRPVRDRHEVLAARRDGRQGHEVQVRRQEHGEEVRQGRDDVLDRKSTRLNSSHSQISYAVFCL